MAQPKSHMELTSAFTFTSPSTGFNPTVTPPPAFETMPTPPPPVEDASPVRRRRTRTPARPRPQPPLESPAHETAFFPGTELPPHMDTQADAVRTRPVTTRERVQLPRAQHAQRPLRRRTPWLTQGTIAALRRMLLPTIAVLAGLYILYLIAAHWANIQPILIQSAATWIISYLLVAMVSRHHLSARDIAAVSTVISVIFLVIGYNVFNIGDSVWSMLGGMFGSILSGLLSFVPIILVVLIGIFLLRLLFFPRR